MNDRQRKQIEQAMQEMDVLRRKHGVVMGDEPYQGDIDAISAALLRGELNPNMSLDELLKGLK